ncbi:hypothetical protein MTBPR1_60074 [Candidatus Terasakiella magnetica]|uniref:Uncharacterized protein n=1 Tax=Candidatus Terasakiella magnetica TaxID=1867952 RepID=A0A1C3RJY9_9PROT|nr:hypothetical protein [Candidatus Terasakiella magnetica]SCA57561.1 hypothetical protein MTBPR1_60074 [Candidatus Terasakiella magnetica]
MDHNNDLADKLKSFIQDIYNSCPNPHKSQKCIEYDDPNDIPCDCKRMRAARQHIQFIENEKK